MAHHEGKRNGRMIVLDLETDNGLYVPVTEMEIDAKGRGGSLPGWELDLFLLEGGVHACKRFLADLPASRQPRESRMRNPDKCKTCKKDDAP